MRIFCAKEGFLLFLAVFCAFMSAIAAALKETESASHSDDAAWHQIVDRYPVDHTLADRIQTWRNFVYATQAQALSVETVPSRQISSWQLIAESSAFPGTVTFTWLADRLGQNDLCIIDCRPQPSYNGGHISGPVRLSLESVRTVVGGISSMLMPVDVLVTELSVMGIELTDAVVLVPDDKLHDATLIGMALERVGLSAGTSGEVVLDPFETIWKNRSVEMLCLSAHMDNPQLRFHLVPLSALFRA